jgi:hypothetical protein
LEDKIVLHTTHAKINCWFILTGTFNFPRKSNLAERTLLPFPQLLLARERYATGATQKKRCQAPAVIGQCKKTAITQMAHLVLPDT